MPHQDTTTQSSSHDLGTGQGEKRADALPAHTTRSARDASSINPEDRAPIDPRMPHLPPA